MTDTAKEFQSVIDAFVCLLCTDDCQTDNLCQYTIAQIQIMFILVSNINLTKCYMNRPLTFILIVISFFIHHVVLPLIIAGEMVLSILLELLC